MSPTGELFKSNHGGISWNPMGGVGVIIAYTRELA